MNEPHGKIRVCYAVNYEKDSDIPPFKAFQPVLGGKLTAVDFEDAITGYRELMQYVQSIADGYSDEQEDAFAFLEELRKKLRMG